MNAAPNIVLFSTILGAIFMALDIYVAIHWTRHIRAIGRHRMWSYAVWFATVVMTALYWFIVWRRHFFRMDGLDVALFAIVCFWFLPKLVIAPVLVIRDVLRLLAKGYQYIRRRVRRTNVQAAAIERVPDSEIPHTPSDDVQNGRRNFLAKAGWATAAVPYVLVGDGLWRTLYDFRVHRVEVVLPNLPRALDGFRILQISDVHAGSFPDHKPFQEARRMMLAEKPDTIVITGDFVNARPHELQVIMSDLQSLSATEGVYASLGNHDHYNTPAEHEALKKALRGAGIDLLVNEHRRIGVGAASLVIAGTDNTGFQQKFGRVDRALRGTTVDDAVVLLAHDPTYWEKAILDTHVGLTLSGHTHGGQFGVNILGYEWSPAQYVYRQWAGLYQKGEKSIYVNRGLGTVGPPLRIGVPPEITVLTLRAPSRDDSIVYSAS